MKTLKYSRVVSYDSSFVRFGRFTAIALFLLTVKMIEKTKSPILTKSEILNEFNSSEERSGNLWIFGYGSLIWKPDFDFECCVVGYIDGFVRRFWQGSIWHRGSKEKPGRVATLVEEKQGQVWGTAFKVAKENTDSVLGMLDEREVGYQLRLLRFQSSDDPTHAFPVLVFAATPRNSLYLGPASPEKMAVQIASARGHAGLNVEYLFRLVDFMREKVPHAKDAHLFEVDKLVRKELGLSTGVLSLDGRS